jgi:hypothetical protein
VTSFLVYAAKVDWLMYKLPGGATDAPPTPAADITAAAAAAAADDDADGDKIPKCTTLDVSIGSGGSGGSLNRGLYVDAEPAAAADDQAYPARAPPTEGAAAVDCLNMGLISGAGEEDKVVGCEAAESDADIFEDGCCCAGEI